MKLLFTWFKAIDNRIWGEKVDSNDYFATCSIMVAALIGAIYGGGTVLNEWFDWNTINWAPISVICVIVDGLFACNVCESIIVSDSIGSSVGRSMLLMLAMALAAAAGYILAVVVVIIICLILGCIAIYVVGGILSAGSGSSGATHRLDDGTDVKESRGLLGEKYYKSNDGRSFHDIGGGRVQED